MTARSAPRLRTAAPYVVASLFTASAAVHLTRPAVFLPLVPGWLPLRPEIVLGSGLGEIVCAAGLFTRRRWAGRASAVLLLVVWIGNLEMAVQASRGTGQGLAGNPWVAWGRVPLQIPLIWAALQARTVRGLPEPAEGHDPRGAALSDPR